MNFFKISKYYDENYLKHSENDAILYFNDANSCIKISHQDLFRSSQKIFETLHENNVNKCALIGILIKSNLLLPSLILSINRYGCPFQCLDNQLNLDDVSVQDFDWIFYSPKAKTDLNINNVKTSVELFDSTLYLIENTTKKGNLKSEICYVITTSGTTGAPKLVYVTNDCIMSNIVHLRDCFSIDDSEVIYLNTPTTFDPFIIELFLFFISCSTLVITSPTLSSQRGRLIPILFPANQFKDIQYNGITFLQITPSLFFSWSQNDIRNYVFGSYSRLRILAFGGEKFPSLPILKRLRPTNDRVEIYNLYGITELSCWSFIYKIRGDEDDVPLGVPFCDTEFRVDSHGELELGSKIRKCFIDNEIHSTNNDCTVFRKTGDQVSVRTNEIYYLGRNNSLIKKFGHRVSLEQIEKFASDFIGKRVVGLYEETNQRIILLVEDSNKTAFRLNELQKFILDNVSRAAVINRIDFIDNIPTTKHGKINRKKINYFDTTPDLFINISKKYLDLNRLNDRLTFKELGGSSMLAIEIINEFETLTSKTVPNLLTRLLTEVPFNEILSSFHSESIESSVSSKKIKWSTDEKIWSEPKKISIKLEIKWQYDLKACIDATPVYYKLKNVVLIGSHSHIFACIDFGVGDKVFECILPDRIEGNVYVNSTREFAYVGCYDGFVYCINLNGGSIKWSYRTESRVKATPVSCLNNDAIIVGSYDKHVHCISQKEGDKIWSQNVEGSVTSDAIVYKGLVLVATIQGVCYCLKEDNGDVIWKKQGPAPIFGSPALVLDGVIWPDVKGFLTCLDYTNGEQKWILNVPGAIYSSIEVDPKTNTIYFGCHNKCCYIVGIEQNSYIVRKKIQLRSPIYSKPSIFYCSDKKLIQLASTKGSVYLYDGETYEEIVELKLPGEIFSSGTIIDQHLIIGCRDDNLYCIQISEIPK